MRGALTRSHGLAVALLACAAVAWMAGPVGRLLVVLPLLLFGPGYLFDRALPALPRAAFCRPVLWLGLSLSAVVLLYEWATALRLPLTPAILGALAACCGLGVLWSVWRGDAPRGSRRARDGSPPQPRRLSGAQTWSLALLAVFALTLWTRFVQIADLALPAWVDSVHHALMIRLAAERGLAPYSLRPYMPVDQLPYHWGYHVFAAAVLQLSGLPLGQMMLWTGQVLNALHVLTVAALAAYLWRRPLAGIVAGIVVGLLSIMPAYYVSWGRYTQLTGLLLLPPLVIAWDAGLRAPSRRWMLCIAVLLAGLSLIHVRVLVFALALMGAIVAVRAIDERPALRVRLSYGAASAGLALALAGPWAWSIASRTLLRVVNRPQNLVGESGYNALNDALLWAGQNRLLVALALAAALYGLLRRSRTAAEQVVWVAGLAVLANPWLVGYLLPAIGAPLALWGAQQRRAPAALGGVALLLLNPALVRLPYLWLLTNDAVVISLFIPIAVLVGGGACMLLAWLENSAQAIGGWPFGRALLRYGGAAVLSGLALWGAWNSRSVINPGTVLATQADVAAIEWATGHTPPDARFLINAVPWLPGVDRGADGGWWLLPLAGRWTSTPPVLYIYGAPEYVRETRQRSADIAGFRGDQSQLYALIEQERVTYVYLGARPGPLSRATFAGDRAFETVYDRDGVTILAVHLHS